MNIGVGNPQVLKDTLDFLQVVDCTSHGGTDVGHYHGWQVAMDADHIVKVLVVDLAVTLPLDHDVSGVQNPHVLENAVMGILGKIEHCIGEHLTCQVKPVHVPFGTPGRNITPGVVRVDGE